MKNLANCKPSEFLVQTNRIRKSVEHWLSVTEVMEIRKKTPVFTEGMTTAERKKSIEDQAMRNLSAILDSVMGDHPQETLEVLALCCFVEPEDVDEHPIGFYLQNFWEMANDESVRGFFTLLTQLGQTDTSAVSRALD